MKTLIKTKNQKRAFHIGLSTVNNLLSPVTGILLSVLVVRFCSRQLWGETVGIMLWVGIATHIVSYGNKDFILREFSLRPSTSLFQWQSSFSTRFLLVLISIPFFLFLHLSFTLFIYVALLIFIRFVYQSYDTLILYKRFFSLTILLESAAFLLIAVFIILFNKSFSLEKLLLLFVSIESAKTLLLLLVLKNQVLPSFKIKSSSAYLLLAFPFFILNFSGMLSSKIDLICVNHFLLKEEVAQYQVFINFLLLGQSSSAFILLPFVKNIYRLKNEIIGKFSVRLFLVGIPVSVIGALLIKFVIIKVYHFEIQWQQLIAGALFILPIFYYLPLIYMLMKLNRQNFIILINALAIAINLLLNSLFIPLYGIYGAILVIAIIQWMMLFIYTYLYFHFRNTAT